MSNNDTNRLDANYMGEYVRRFQILQNISGRLIAQGYKIENGKIIEPELITN